jgi:hypothetical protein
MAHDFIANIPQAVVLLLGNLALGLVVMNMLRNQGRQLRIIEETAQAVGAGD